MKLGVLTVTKRPHLLSNVVQMMAAQGKLPDQWIVYGHGFGSDNADLKDAFVQAAKRGITFWFSDWSFDDRLAHIRNHGFDILSNECKCSLVATFDDDDYYAPTYLQDLVQSVEMWPEGGIYGIQRYWIGWVKGTLQSDGGNIFGKWMSEGGKVLKANHVTWVVDATIAVKGDIWRDKLVRFGIKPRRDDGTESGGECENVMTMANEQQIPIVSRDPSHFCVVRVIHEDGWGGKHQHTWGPLEYREPAPEPAPEPPPPLEPATPPLTEPSLENLLRSVGRKLFEHLKPQETMPACSLEHIPENAELGLFVRRKTKACIKKLKIPVWQEHLVCEDTRLEPGIVQWRYGGIVLRSHAFSADGEG